MGMPLAFVRGRTLVKGVRAKEVSYVGTVEDDGYIYFNDGVSYRVPTPATQQVEQQVSLSQVQVWYTVRNCWIRANYFTDLSVYWFDPDDMYDRIEDHERRIDSLEDRMDDIEDRMDVVESRCTALETRCTNLENRMDDVEYRCTALETRCTVIEGRCDVLENRCTRLETRCTDLETRMTSAENDISALQTRMTTAEGRIDTCVLRINTLNSRCDDIEDDIDDINNLLGAGLPNVLSPYTTVSDYLAALSQRVSNIENVDLPNVWSTINADSQRISNLEYWQIGANTELNTLTTSYNNLINNVLVSMDNAIQDLDTQLSNLDTAFTNLVNTTISNINSDIITLTNNYTTIVNEVNILGRRALGNSNHSGGNGEQLIDCFNALRNLISWAQGQGYGGIVPGYSIWDSWIDIS